jgi:hypothetical protein
MIVRQISARPKRICLQHAQGSAAPIGNPHFPLSVVTTFGVMYLKAGRPQSGQHRQGILEMASSDLNIRSGCALLLVDFQADLLNDGGRMSVARSQMTDTAGACRVKQ